MISELHHMGLSISYDRILEIENQMASSLCHRANDLNLVCPSKLKRGLFTIGALDNLDHNSSSTTAKDFFHSTGISLFSISDTAEPEGRGKKLAWETWKCFPEASTAFVSIETSPITQIEIDSFIFSIVYKDSLYFYTVKPATSSRLMKQEKDLFCHNNNTMENIPPTSDALLQHARRAAYQASI